MKVLIICKALEGPYTGGIQTHVSDLAQTLSSARHHVSILTAGNPFKSGLRSPWATITTLPYWPKSLAPWLYNFLGDWSFNVFAALWVRIYAQKFDVIHIHGRSGLMLHKSNTDIPVVQTIHGVFDKEQMINRSEYKSSFDLFLHKRWVTAHQEKMNLFCKEVIAVSRDTATQFAASTSYWHLKDIHIIPNGIFAVKSSTIMSISTNTLLFVGRLAEAKGIDVLIESMLYIDPKIQLIIIGDGPMRDNLKKLAAKYNLTQRIKFIGRQPRPKVIDWMIKSRAIVTPSTYEPQGIVILEAASVGKPIIASNSCGIPEFIEDGINGMLTYSNSPIELSSKINEVFARPSFAKALGAMAKQKVDLKYQWDNICLRVINVYKSSAA